MLKEKTDDLSIVNTVQIPHAVETTSPMCRSLWKTWWENLLLFCLTGVYVELCLHLCVFRSLDRYAGYPVLFSLFEHQMRQGWIWFRISKITCSRPRVTERRRLTLLTTGWPATAGDRKTVWEFTSGMQSPSPISRRGHLNLIGSISTGIFPKTEKVLPEI